MISVCDFWPKTRTFGYETRLPSKPRLLDDSRRRDRRAFHKRISLNALSNLKLKNKCLSRNIGSHFLSDKTTVHEMIDRKWIKYQRFWSEKNKWSKTDLWKREPNCFEMSKQAEVIKNRWTELPLDDLHLLNRIDDMSYAQLSETDQEWIKEIQERVRSRRPREQVTKPCCHK